MVYGVWCMVYGVWCCTLKADAFTRCTCRGLWGPLAYARTSTGRERTYVPQLATPDVHMCLNSQRQTHRPKSGANVALARWRGSKLARSDPASKNTQSDPSPKYMRVAPPSLRPLPVLLGWALLCLSDASALLLPHNCRHEALRPRVFETRGVLSKMCTLEATRVGPALRWRIASVSTREALLEEAMSATAQRASAAATPAAIRACRG